MGRRFGTCLSLAAFHLGPSSDCSKITQVRAKGSDYAGVASKRRKCMHGCSCCDIGCRRSNQGVTNRFHMMSMSGYFSANLGDSGFCGEVHTQRTPVGHALGFDFCSSSIFAATAMSEKNLGHITARTTLYSSELHHVCVVQFATPTAKALLTRSIVRSKAGMLLSS